MDEDDTIIEILKGRRTFNEKDKIWEWRNSAGELHRENGPALEGINGDKSWWFNGKAHRDDGPAVERAYGYKAWWFNGKLHRVGGPAIERPDGSKEWWIDGHLHYADKF